MTDSPGQRVRELRVLLGDGTYPLSQQKLADRLTDLSGVKYRGDMVAKMEMGVRRVTDKDARWLAKLDPRHRGIGWVLCWPEETKTPPVAGGVNGQPSWGEENIAAMEAQAARDDAAQAARNGTPADEDDHPHTKPARRAK